MTEELKDLFRRTRPAPDPEAKAAALRAARAAFEQEKSAALQGTATGRRLKARQSGLIGRILGRAKMDITLPSLKPLLIGGTSIAAIAVALVVMRDDGLRQHLENPFVEPTSQGMPSQGAVRTAGTEAAPQPPADANRQRSQDLRIAPEKNADGADAGRREMFLERDAEEGASLQVLQSQPAEPATLPGLAKTEGAVRVEEQGRSSSVGAGTGGDHAAEMRENEAIAVAPVAPSPGAVMQKAKPAVGLYDRAGTIAPQPPIVVDPPQPNFYRDEGRDKFAEIDTNPPKVTAEEPVSTFSIDVDTASYAFARKAIMQGVLPQPNAVRVEEMINYFPYDYAPPADRETPFATHVEIMPTPWNEATKLMRIGIKGFEIPATERPQANLVFLIDSSGSMNAPDKLPLLLNSFRLLLEELDGDDSVAIVAYAGGAGTVLEPTPASEKQKILAALGQLHAGGSTAGAEGIRQAYQLAEQAFVDGGVNRVLLATDGDFNVGITSPEELKGFVERKRETGVMLSVLGFGQGNLNDELMQTLAQNGNGAAAYIDTLSEARKALVEEAGSTLFPIAKDVKIQIEFNPATVAEYRLIGYETRMLAREDFNNDKVDAGEIGSGHSVTALYELTPVGSAARQVDDLRYGVAADAAEEAATPPPTGHPDELGFLKIRYKAPDGDVSQLIETPITRSLETDDPGTETRFAAAVAAFGQLLRGGEHTGDFTYDDVAALAQGAKGPDPFGYRAEFVNLVRLAGSAAAMQPLKQ